MLYRSAAVSRRSGTGRRSEGVLQKARRNPQPWQPQRTRGSPRLHPNLLNSSSAVWPGTYAAARLAMQRLLMQWFDLTLNDLTVVDEGSFIVVIDG